MKKSSTAVKEASRRGKAPVGQIYSFFGGYKKVLAVSLMLSLIYSILSLYLPFLFGQAIDAAAGPGSVDIDTAVSLLIRAGVVLIFAVASQRLLVLVNNKIAYVTVRDIRKKAFEKIQKLPLSYTDSHPTGETVSRVINDAEQFSNGLLIGFTQLFTGIVTMLGTLVFMLVLDYKIAVLVILLTPLSLFVAKFIASRTHSMFKLQAETAAEQTAFIEEMISSQKTVKAYGHEKQNIQSFGKINQKLTDTSLKAVFFSSLTNPCTRFVNNIVYAAVALAGALTVISAADTGTPELFTVGMLSCFLAYANQYSKPFNEITGVITELQNAFICAGRIFELINQKEEVQDSADCETLDNADGNIELDHVYFSYIPEKKLIEDFNLSVKRGTKIAIVGPSGCGKTTLINLLMRFYDTSSGLIAVDGHDIRSLSRHSLRKSYGMVLQETWLKSGTVRDNITFGKPDATDDEIVAAAKAAHAHGFITRLQSGYDTFIGEDGGSLSQGQKQLLCITRVMLSLPPMLILDEATSSIDTLTEQKIQKAFAKMTANRTSFVVAHRLSTIMESDVILVMKDGNIIEKGSHKELIAKGGFYRKLWDSRLDI